MILLDAGALVSLLAGEPGARDVERILRDEDAAIPAANLAESIDILVRVFDNELESVEAKVVPLLATVLPVVPLGELEARRGAEIRITHYHRQRAPLSLADCLLLGTALVNRASVATSDPYVAYAGRKEQVAIERLPDTSGRRP